MLARVAPGVEQAMNDILDAIGRARVADKRLRLVDSLCDEAGLQLAYQAILHNLSVIGDAVSAIPEEILERDQQTPWSQFVEPPGLIVPDYFRIDPAQMHRIVETDLGALDVAVRRLRATLQTR